jgi:hypothetical protein
LPELGVASVLLDVGAPCWIGFLSFFLGSKHPDATGKTKVAARILLRRMRDSHAKLRGIDAGGAAALGAVDGQRLGAGTMAALAEH